MENQVVTWSPQQEAFFDWGVNGTGSCNLVSLAGTGKTTSLIELIRRIEGQVAVMAFNKKIADEVKGKLAKLGVDWKKAQAGTVHSFGLSAFCKTFPDFDRRNGIQGYKVEDIIKNSQDEFAIAYCGTICKLVSLAKQRALGVVQPIESREAWLDIIWHFDLLSDLDDDDGKKVDVDKVIEAGRKFLLASNAKTDVIDFDDMCYLPVLLKCRFWQFDVVIIDEAQDTNPARRAIVRAMVKRGGRVIAVGDPNQAIYGFTGADADSMDLIRRDFNSIDLPLTVTYRCPKSVVTFAQQWVPAYEAHPSAPDGEVLVMQEADFLARKDLLVAGNAILCRVTKPLITLAFRLIRARIPCNIEGRDIAAGLVKLATKWRRAKNIESLEERLEAYLDKQKTRLLAKRMEDALQALEDQVEALRAIIDQCRIEKKDRVEDVVGYINALFADGVENVLVLSTIHKAKGREWEVVAWYDRDGTCPSRWARQAWQKQAEINLMYVAATRAKHTLIDLKADPSAQAKKPAPAPKSEALETTAA